MTAGLEVGSPATEAFRAARNQLMGWRGDHRAAVSGFRWPDVGDRFNWAVDWFDAIARGNDAAGLVVLEEDARSRRSPLRPSSTRWRARSDQVAALAAAAGGREGRPGHPHARQPGRAVGGDARASSSSARSSCRRPPRSVRPTSRDRIGRGGGPASSSPTPTTPASSTDVPGDYGRLAVTRAGPRRRLGAFDDAYRLDAPPCRAPGHRARRPAAAVLHLRDHEPAQARRAHPGVLPGRPSVDDVLARPASPATCTSTSRQPGWAKHAWSCFFAPWIAEATVFVYNYARFDAAGAARRASATTRSPASARRPTVWRMLINADLSGGPGRLREVDRGRRAAEPRGHRAGEQGAGASSCATATARPRRPPQVGNTPGSAGQARLDGPAATGGAGRARRPADRRAGRRGRPGEGEICLDLSDAPAAADDRLPGRRRAQRRGDGRRVLPHR